MKNLIALTIATSLSAAAFAASETYNIEVNHTMPRFEYSHMGYSTQSSRFDRTTGTITIDRAARTGSVDVVIDAKSVNSGSAKFNEHLQSLDFFDTESYPTITFKSHQMTFVDDSPVTVEGDLTIKGVTKPVTLTVTSFLCMPHPMLKQAACGANATTTINRSDFNLGKYVPLVSDEVVVTIPVESIEQ